MSVEVKHGFTSTWPDSADPTEIQPSHWNSDHAVVLTGPALIGREISGAGAAEEITLDTSLSLSAGVLSVNSYAGSVVANFGTFADRTSHTSVSVAGQTAILSTSEVTVEVSLAGTADHNSDEHLVCGIKIRVGTITPGAGFVLHLFSAQGRDYGQYNIDWRYRV